MNTDPDSSPLILFLLILILTFNALVVLCNIAFGTLNANRAMQKAEEADEPRAKQVARILERPFRFRYTNKFLNYVLLILGTALTIMLPYEHWIALLVFGLAAVSFGELLPRKIAIQHSEAIASAFCGFQQFLMILTAPFILIVTFLTDIVLRLFRQKTKIEFNRYSEEEVMSMLEAGQQSGEIKEEGKKMINSIFEFDDELAYEIMTPRTDVFLIDINDPPEEYLDEFLELRYSRVPVCEDESDNIIGILHIKDYLIKARETGFENVDIRSILRAPYFVPETKNIDALFFELQREKQHIAILIDEYGGFSGIVTMEDIIEEVMGEIDDEYDEEEETIKKQDDSTYIINGKTYLDDINEELGTELVSENSETIGGLVIELLGEIPGEEDEERTVTYRNYQMTVLSVKERRIETIKLTILPETEEEKGEDEE